MERLTNITEIIEKQRLGFNVPKQLDLVYYKLKSIEDDFILPCNQVDSVSPVFTSKFCHLQNLEHFLLSANEDGKIVLIDTRKQIKKVNEGIITIQGHDNAIFDLAWVDNDISFLSTSGDHSATLWQIKDGHIQPLRQFLGHTHSVKAVSCRPDDPNVFSTGGRDGTLIIWDKRMPAAGQIIEPYKMILHSHEVNGFFSGKRYGTQVNSVTGVVYQDENNLISCSAGDGLIKVWDMRKTYCIKKRRLPQAKNIMKYAGLGRNGFSHLAISPCRLKLYANAIDDFVYCYNIGTYETNPVAKYGGFQRGSSFYIKNSVSPDGRYIAAGGTDGNVYIWSVAKPASPLVTLSGHVAEVTCVEWAQSGELKMATCSDDGSVRIWRPHPKEMACNDPMLRGWASRVLASKSGDNLSDSTRRKRKYYTSRIQTPQKVLSELSENVSPEIKQAEKKQCMGSSMDMSSLTADLPNFVIDGRSPHNHFCTHTPKQKDGNWLSKLKAKTSELKSSEKSPQLVGSRRRSSARSSARGSLLKFFKVSSRSNSCDQSTIPSADVSHQCTSLEA